MPGSTNSSGKIRTAAKSLRALLRDLDMGRFAIPKLQREFVWDGPKAAKLLDSIYRGMPVGTILIWETPKSQRLYLRHHYNVLPPFSDKNGKVWFLIDGQQRVSVLHHVREGGSLRNSRGREIDFSRVVFCVNGGKDNRGIRYRTPSPGRFVPMCHVLHPQWRQKLADLTQTQLRRVQDCRQRVLTYGMHLMFVRMKIGEVRECFLRVNTQGMKVTTADAIFTQAESLDLRDVVHEVKQHLDLAFRDIPEMPILWSVAALRGATDARGRTVEQAVRRMERDAKKDRKLRKELAKDWMRLGRCFGKAVDYLRQHFMVLNRDFLYSDYVVAMLALFFFWHGRGPSRSQRGEINKWFWATAVGSRYSGRDFSRCVPDDARFFRKLAEGTNTRFRFSQTVDRIDVRKTQYTGHTGIGAAFYVLLLRRGPVSILDEALNPIPIDRYSTPANRKDRHHIFARGPLTGAGVPANRYNSICNICLLTAEENQAVGARRPRSYLRDVAGRKGLFKAKMRRHLIPVDENSGVWDHDIKRGYSRFVKEREGMICRALEQEARIPLFRREA